MNNIVVDKKRLSIKLNGAIPTRDILGSLDELVDAAIASPSNYVKPISNKKKIPLAIILELITTKDGIR